MVGCPQDEEQTSTGFIRTAAVVGISNFHRTRSKRTRTRMTRTRMTGTVAENANGHQLAEDAPGSSAA